MPSVAQAYLDLAADDRLEARIPHQLKVDAEAAAKARGQTLTQWLLAAMAEKVSADFAATITWQLTAAETANLLRLLSAPSQITPALAAAQAKSAAVFGENPR